MKFDINKIEFETFETFYPLKQEHLRANNTGFITKDMGKLIFQELHITSSEIFALVFLENQSILLSK